MIKAPISPMPSMPSMQMPLPPIQGSAPALQSKANLAPDNQFQRNFERQLAQRQAHDRQANAQASAHAPAPAHQARAAAANANATATATAAPASATADDKTADDKATDASGVPAGGTPAQADATPKAAPAASDTGDTQSALSGPVADMLAMLASFNQPIARAPDVRPAGSPDLAAALAAAATTARVVKAGITDAAFDAAAALKASAQAPGDGADVPFADSAPGGAAAARAASGSAAAAVLAARDAGPTDRAAAIPAVPDGQTMLASAAAPGAIKLREVAPEVAPAAKDVLPLPAAPLSQAALDIARTAPALAPEQFSARIGNSAWDQQLGQKIVWMVTKGEQSASLTLNPPDLGPLQVVLKVSNDQASATFTAAQPEVRQALEAAMPRLREMMSDAGIFLGDASVSAGASQQDGANQQAQREMGRDAGQDAGRDAGRNSERDAGPAQGNGALHGVAAPLRAAALGMVDTFA